MNNKMKWSQFLKGLQLALGSKTTYAFGGFGWPLNEANKKRLLQNKNNLDFAKAINAGNKNVFAFDCVCLIKGILWGWNANPNVNYGGAVYNSNGVPDVNATQMMTSAHITGQSTDFSKIKVGAFVGMKGHIGVYIGNGEVIECTPIWGAKVLKSKLKDRVWLSWGMSKYIDYSDAGNDVKPTPKPDPKPDSKLVIEKGYEIVLNTNIYERNEPNTNNPAGREQRLKGSVIQVDAYIRTNGYLWRRIVGSGKYIPVTDDSNDQKWAKLQKVSDSKPAGKTNEQLADEVLAGKWGNGAERKKRLEDAGHDYYAIQDIVNDRGNAKPTFKVGDKVRAKLGSVYQNRTDGKTVESWASKQVNPIVQIVGDKAHVGGNVNSWVLLKDLVKA